ncbi:PREDICTED: E3 ubiquitin-protein ligase TRIM41-like, partial [Corvus brachyrhynchos]|uniref:E3 ubiquitin-protein ligase TRIM41-like n=1 Tax=Corvus brachyrhynchos TaxID=85066 RepID=UPI0008166476
DVEQEEEEDEAGVEEEEDDDMWEEEEEEEAELWEDPAEDEEEEEEEEATAWAGGAQGGLYFGDEDFDEDVMEEDVEEEEEAEEEEEDAPGGPPELCEKHQEPLKLFCEVDEAAICVVCREARGHKHHSVVPLDEVVQDCKNKLQSHLEPLRKQLDAVLKQKSSEEEKISVLREQMQVEMQELEADFEVLHRFLAGEQVLLLRQLQERHEALLARQRRNLGALEERSSALRRLIADAEAAGRQDGLQLLKDIKGTFIRCENIKFQEPEMVPVDVGKKFRNCFLQDVVMRKMEKVFSKVPQGGGGGKGENLGLKK